MKASEKATAYAPKTTSTLRHEVEEPQGLRAPASPFVRLVARLVDFMTVIALVLVLAFLTGTLGEPPAQTGVDVGWLVVFAAAVVVETLLLRWWGRTPGKAAFGLWVTAAAGGRLPWARAAARALVAWSPLLAVTGPVVARWQLALCAALVAVLGGTALVRSDHRGLQDLLVDSVVLRPVRARPAVLELAGIDLAVLGAAGFLSAYGAYGFAAPTPTWYFDNPPVASYGSVMHVALAPEGARIYIFGSSLGSGERIDCRLQSGGGSVVPVAGVLPPTFEDSFVPGFADPVRALQPLYRVTGTSGSEGTVTCSSTTGTSGSYAVGAVVVPDRRLGNVLEGVSAGLGVGGLALLLLGRRAAKS